MLSITCAVLFLAAVANAQTDCRQNLIQAGMPYASDEDSGQRFIKCDERGNEWKMQCADGTLFDQRKFVCTYPADASVFSWPCSNANVGTLYSALCCRKYWRCTGTGFVLEECADGQSFNPSSGQCGTANTAANCEDEGLYCEGQGPAPAWVCPYKEHVGGNACRYNYNDIQMSCAAGTAWNQTACSCTTFSSDCLQDVGLAKNLVLDAQCRASFKSSFTTSGISVVSEKINDNQETNLNIGWRPLGVTFESNRVVLRTDAATNSPPELFTWFFSNKEMASPFLIQLSFKFATSGTVANTFTLLTNNYMDACTPTFKAEVTRNNNQVTLTVTATGVSSGGVETQGTATATVQANAGNVVRATIAFNGALRASLCDRGASGTNNCNAQASNPSTNIGEKIKANACGWGLFRGLIGEVSQITVYEGCGDFTVRGLA